MKEYIPGQKTYLKQETSPKNVTRKEKIKSILTMLDEKKAVNLKVMYLHNVNSYLDYFILATANSNTHINALGREISKLMKSFNEYKYNASEQNKENWLLLDYVDIVIHIFTEEARSFYNLDKLWSDGEDLTKEYLL